LALLRRSSLDSRTTLGRATGAQESSLFWIAVLTGMAALLLTVGFLQYRWTNQLTEATETRIGSNVESLMLDWHLDFYQSFAAICVVALTQVFAGMNTSPPAWRSRS
jgi:hypothetical protein